MSQALSIGLLSLSPMEVQLLFPRYDVADLDRLPSAFYQSSLYALELALCSSLPQIRYIQVRLTFPLNFFKKHTKHTLGSFNLLSNYIRKSHSLLTFTLVE